MKIAVYLRVSTDTQTVDNQVPDIENYLKQYPDAEIVFFRENDTAAKQGHQKELARLRSQIQSGRTKYDMLVVWAFDRLTRLGAVDLINQYYFFLRHGVKITSIKEEWSNIAPEIVPCFLAWWGYLAQMESKRRSERTKAGLERVRKYGSKSGIGIGKRGKDKAETKRKKAGYYNRWINKQRIEVLHEVSSDNLDSQIMQNVTRN